MVTITQRKWLASPLNGREGMYGQTISRRPCILMQPFLCFIVKFYLSSDLIIDAWSLKAVLQSYWNSVLSCMPSPVVSSQMYWKDYKEKMKTVSLPQQLTALWDITLSLIYIFTFSSPSSKEHKGALFPSHEGNFYPHEVDYLQLPQGNPVSWMTSRDLNHA